MRKRLLFLSHRVPYPPHSGAAIRSYNVLRELSKEFEIDALCFHRVDSATAGISMASRLEALAPFAACEVFPIPQQASRARLAWDHLRSVLTLRGYTWYMHSSREFEARLSSLLAERHYDVIHVDSLDLVRVLESLPLGIVACTHHNVESELLARRARRESSALRRLYLRLQSALLLRLEREWAPRVAVNLCTSTDDAATLRRLAPGARTFVVPNGVDDEFFSPMPIQRKDGLVFVGGTSWYPNKDALEWFVAEVLPVLRRDGVSSPVTWVGRVTEAERRELTTVPGLLLTGYVDDVRPYLAEAAAFVAPIRVGGGTRLKILDAWAMGTPMIATRAAMEGLDATDGENYLLAETPSEFSAAVARLLSDRSLAAALASRGRRTVENAYSWRTIGANLRGRYMELTTSGPATSPDQT